MRSARFIVVLAGLVLLTSLGARAADAPVPAPDKPKKKMPFVDLDLAKKQVRVECEALNVGMPLEFFLTGPNGPDHETCLRTGAQPFDVHMAMMGLGLVPGEPVKYSPSAQKWMPPHGPPLHIYCEYEKDGKTVSTPAYRWLRNVKTKKEAPPFTWVFTGSRVMEDGNYAANFTGYLISVVNFELTVIDVPKIASNANETLEWEFNPDLVPKAGTKVILVIEAAGKNEPVAPAQPDPGADAIKSTIDVSLVTIDAAGKIDLEGRTVPLEELVDRLKQMKEKRPIKIRIAPAPNCPAEIIKKVKDAAAAAEVDAELADVASNGISDVTADQALVKRLRQRWEKQVSPHKNSIKEAAQAQYEVINALRREQQRLIDEADRIQRVIDQLEKEYQEMTTPRPEP